MNHSTESALYTPIEIPLVLSDRALAKDRSDRDGNCIIRDRVRRNCLALAALRTYCRYLGVPTWTGSCESNDPAICLLDDVADVQVSALGRVDCRPVAPQDKTLRIPAEILDNRDAYVAVELDSEERRARLLGFAIAPIASDEIPLTDLIPIPDLFETLAVRKPQIALATEVSRLTRWLDGVFETGWSSVEHWLDDTSPQAAWAFRNATLPERAVKRGKRLELGNSAGNVALLTTVEPANAQELAINIDLWSAEGSDRLPVGLQAAVIDENGRSIMQSEATANSAALKFEFNVNRGEAFQVVVALDRFQLTEYFMA